ncbi:hypothetical protein BDZ91DRAFT_745058 [Kalaharituber pfeilii]|nr:hypothetical protein BDZ91DRAFT_745058 [Kalaharituber pfeilii]
MTYPPPQSVAAHPPPQISSPVAQDMRRPSLVAAPGPTAVATACSNELPVGYKPTPEELDKVLDAAGPDASEETADTEDLVNEDECETTSAQPTGVDQEQAGDSRPEEGSLSEDEETQSEAEDDLEDDYSDSEEDTDSEEDIDSEEDSEFDSEDELAEQGTNGEMAEEHQDSDDDQEISDPEDDSDSDDVSNNSTAKSSGSSTLAPSIAATTLSSHPGPTHLVIVFRLRYPPSFSRPAQFFQVNVPRPHRGKPFPRTTRTASIANIIAHAFPMPAGAQVSRAREYVAGREKWWLGIRACGDAQVRGWVKKGTEVGEEQEEEEEDALGIRARSVSGWGICVEGLWKLCWASLGAEEKWVVGMEMW